MRFSEIYRQQQEAAERTRLEKFRLLLFAYARGRVSDKQVAELVTLTAEMGYDPQRVDQLIIEVRRHDAMLKDAEGIEAAQERVDEALKDLEAWIRKNAPVEEFQMRERSRAVEDLRAIVSHKRATLSACEGLRSRCPELWGDLAAMNWQDLGQISYRLPADVENEGPRAA